MHCFHERDGMDHITCYQCKWFHIASQDKNACFGTCRCLPGWEWKYETSDACSLFNAKDKLNPGDGEVDCLNCYALGGDQMKAKVLAEVDEVARYCPNGGNFGEGWVSLFKKIRTRIEGLEL